MSMEFLVEADGGIYEISQLVKSVSWTDTLNDGCGKLEFAYRAGDLNLTNGASVRFRYDGAALFRDFTGRGGDASCLFPCAFGICLEIYDDQGSGHFIPS